MTTTEKKITLAGLAVLGLVLLLPKAEPKKVIL
jgi:hypothetical protein